MTALTAIPVEEYLRTSYDPDVDYVDGRLVERNVGEYFHSRLQLLLGVLLASHERQRRYRVFTEQRVRLDSTRFRIPDICVLSLPFKVVPVLERPDLAIEIVSPDDRFSSVLEKVAEYLHAGVPHVWIADPYQRIVFEADAEGVREATNRRLSTPLTGEVDFNELFAALDESTE
jgi:Uma2 family endonuclease